LGIAGLVTAQNGLTVSSGATSVAALTASGLVTVADSISIKGTQPIKGIVCGTATTSNVGSATSVTGTVSMSGYNFANAPIVILTHTYAGTAYVISGAVTATGTSWFNYTWVFSSGFGSTVTFNWIAIGT
jgi:hypothetical protein